LNNSELIINNSKFRMVNSAGFTLLELILVMALMMVILGLSTVYFAGRLPSSRLGAVAREVSGMVRYAGSFAVASGEAQSVVIDLDSRYYGIEGKGLKAIPAGIGVMVTDPFYGDINHGKYFLRLRPTGGIEGGKIVLWMDNRRISLYPDPVVGIIAVKQR
jgi:general secretion pathway protein H